MYEVSFGYVEREEVGAECLRKSGRERGGWRRMSQKKRERGETGKERGFCVVYVSKETYMCQKRPACVKRDLHVSKETYMCQKRLLSV
jgi:hypothetical protein